MIFSTHTLLDEESKFLIKYTEKSDHDKYKCAACLPFLLIICRAKTALSPTTHALKFDVCNCKKIGLGDVGGGGGGRPGEWLC